MLKWFLTIFSLGDPVSEAASWLHGSYIAFDVFFFLVSRSRALFMPSLYVRTFVTFDAMIWPRTELKKSLDIFRLRLERKGSEEK